MIPNRKRIAYRYAAAMALLLAFSSVSNAGVRQDMKGIATVDSLYKYYDRYKTNTYIVRYIVKYLPDFLTQRGIFTCPSWVNTLAGKALYSNDDALITEAISLIGYYKLQGYTDRLNELYSLAVQQYLSYSTQMRTAIIKSLQQIGGVDENIQLIKIFNSYSTGHIMQSEFMILAETLAHMQTFGMGETAVDQETLSSHVSFCKSQEAMLDDSKFDQRQLKERYARLITYLQAIQSKVAQAQGGTHE
jgi:hypothetical protein